MSKHDGYKNWDAHFHSEAYEEVLDKKQVVYLSSESENVLTELEEGKFYVIGGLVDHNNHKGLCHRLAVEKGVSHARLPIDEYISMKTRRVLTIDHVFAILAAVSAGKSWKEAFMSILPARKGAETKEGEDDDVVPEDLVKEDDPEAAGNGKGSEGAVNEKNVKQETPNQITEEMVVLKNETPDQGT